MYGNVINELNAKRDGYSHVQDADLLIDDAIKDINAATSKEEVDKIRNLVLAKLEAIRIIQYDYETQNDKQMIADYISNIKQATDITTVEEIEEEALDWKGLPGEAKHAISDIHVAMQGEHDNAVIKQVVANDIQVIKWEYENDEIVNERRDEAIRKLDIAVPVYRNSKAELLGTLGTPQAGPAIEVTDQNGKVVKLYNPKNAIITEEK